jgi:hypothetical protein
VDSTAPEVSSSSSTSGELRGTIYRKHMFYSQYTKNRNIKTWEKFRKQRNLVTKLKTYFLERCTGGANTPVSIDKFINDVNWLDIIGLHCLITLAGMLSNPEASFIFNLSIIFSKFGNKIKKEFYENLFS